MNNEYITKQQAIDLVKSLEVVLGCLGVSVLTRELERLEAKGPHILPDVAWSEIKLEWRPYYEHNIKHVHIAIDRTYSKEQIEFVLREMLEQVLTMTEEEKTRPLI